MRRNPLDYTVQKINDTEAEIVLTINTSNRRWRWMLNVAFLRLGAYNSAARKKMQEAADGIKEWEVPDENKSAIFPLVKMATEKIIGNSKADTEKDGYIIYGHEVTRVKYSIHNKDDLLITITYKAPAAFK